MSDVWVKTRNGIAKTDLNQVRHLLASGKLKPTSRLLSLDAGATWTTAEVVLGRSAPAPVFNPDEPQASSPSTAAKYALPDQGPADDDPLAELTTAQSAVSQLKADPANSGVDWQGTAAAASHAAIGKTKEALSNSAEAFKVLAINPTEGISQAFQMLGKSKALQVALVCLVVFDASVLLVAVKLVQLITGGFGASSSYYGSRASSIDIPVSYYFKFSLLAAVPLLAIAGAMTIGRLVGHGKGAWQGDAFVAGIALVPFSVAFLALAARGKSHLSRWITPDFL
ncbi:MAG: hypothetical protein WD042_20295, partial [Phycisphaeraceae bacterium]